MTHCTFCFSKAFIKKATIDILLLSIYAVVAPHHGWKTCVRMRANVCVPDQDEDDDPRADPFPHPPPVPADGLSDHLLNLCYVLVCAVHPAHSNAFTEPTAVSHHIRRIVLPHSWLSAYTRGSKPCYNLPCQETVMAVPRTPCTGGTC